MSAPGAEAPGSSPEQATAGPTAAAEPAPGPTPPGAPGPEQCPPPAEATAQAPATTEGPPLALPPPPAAPAPPAPPAARPARARAAPPALALAQTPRPLRWAARLLFVSLVVLPVALLLVPWQQNVQGTGRVVAYAPPDRRQTLEAPIDGRVVQWWVQEGSVVRRGDRLVEIADNDPDLMDRLREQREAAGMRLEAAQARLEAFEAQLALLRDAQRLSVAAAGDRVSMAEDRVEAALKGLEAARASLVTAKLNLERTRSLAADGLASQRSLELADLEVQRGTAEVERAEAGLSAARNEVNSLVAERARTEADAGARIDAGRASRDAARSDLASARAEVARIDVTLARQSTQVITAPRAGTVFRLIAQPGAEFVKAGDPVLVLIPEAGERAVELWVDGNDAPLISPGRHVRLQFEGWPAVQFVGWPSVAVGTYGGRVDFVDSTDDGQGRFRLVIVPQGDTAPDDWPPSTFLRQGVRTKGWVLLEQVRLGWELWRQVNGFPPTISPESQQALGLEPPTRGKK